MDLQTAEAAFTDTSGKSHLRVDGPPEPGRRWYVDNRGTFQYASGKHSFPNAVIVNSSGNVFMAGYGDDAAGREHWLLRKR